MEKNHVRIVIAMIIISTVIAAVVMVIAFTQAKPSGPQWAPPSIGPAPTPNWSSPNALPEAPWDQPQAPWDY